MNRITEVTVRKLFGRDNNDCTVKFQPIYPVTFIYGFNGIGKTTLFRLLEAVLSHDGKVLQSIQFESIRIKFDTEETLVVTKKELPDLEKEDDCTGKDIDAISGDSDISYEYTWEYQNGEKNQKYFFNKIDMTPKVFPTEKICVKSWYANPLHDPKVLETAKEEGNACSGESAAGKYTCYKVPDRMDDLQRKIKRFKTVGKAYEKKFKLFGKVIDTKSGLTDKYFTIEDDGEITLTVEQNDREWLMGFPLEILSPGEQNLFLLYFQLIFELPDKCPKNGMCLLMIDEPETSMHPEWLADFYDNLDYINGELGRIGNYQFLIATHSPVIAFRHNRMVTEMSTVS